MSLKIALNRETQGTKIAHLYTMTMNGEKPERFTVSGLHLIFRSPLKMYKV